MSELPEYKDAASPNESLPQTPCKSFTEDFSLRLRSSILISSKNKALLQKAKKIQHKSDRDSLQIFDFDSPDLESKASRRGVRNITLTSRTDEDLPLQKIDPNSPILLFIVEGKSLQNIISDYDRSQYESNFISHQKSCSETHDLSFSMGRIRCHEQNFVQALENFNRALELSPHNLHYQLWRSMISLKVSAEVLDHSQATKGTCCTSRSKPSRHKHIKKIAWTLNTLPKSVEALWALTEICLMNVLKTGVEIEDRRYYACKIKELDSYYGYLAWAQIALKENDQIAIRILLEIIQVYPNRPEGYYLAWNYYFNNKHYEKCKEIAAESFLKVTDSDSTHYYIIFCLRLAKSYFYIGDLQNCIELLHKKFLEHPTYTVFMFYFAKYCVKAEDMTMSGIAKGTLKELLRICHKSRTGAIYYWLAKSYLVSRQFPSAYKYIVKAILELDPSKKQKIGEMQKKCVEFKPFMEEIVRIRQTMKEKSPDELLLNKCEEVKDFHRPTGDMLYAEALYARGNVEASRSLLRNMVSISRIETTAYFRLLEYDPLTVETTFKALLMRTKSTETPAQTWVKASLLYAKFMFNSSRYNKAFYSLRVLAKILPPLPSAHIPYCLSLQNSDTFQELEKAFQKIIQNEKHPQTGQESLCFNLGELANKIFTHTGADGIILTPLHKKAVEGRRYKKFNSFAIDEDLADTQSIKSAGSTPGEPYLTGFCICSKPKFLYYIAKFSSHLKKNKQEGLLAIADYFELLKFEKNRLKAERSFTKAVIVQRRLAELE